MIKTMKRDSKLNYLNYREPYVLRKGVGGLAEQALEFCTEQDTKGTFLNARGIPHYMGTFLSTKGIPVTRERCVTM